MTGIFEDLEQEMGTYYDAFILFLPKLLIAVFLLVIYVIIAGWLRRKFVKLIRSRTSDITLVDFFNKIIKMVNVIVGLFIFLVVIGKTGIAGSLLGATSLSAIVIGFAFKDIAENFLAGIIMAFKRRYSVGDTILTNGVEGNIVALNLRDTHVKTFDGKDVYVPNGMILKSPLYNYTIDGFLRYNLLVDIDPNADLTKALSIVKSSISQDADIMSDDKTVNVFVTTVSASRIKIKAQYWLNLDTISKGSLAIKTEAFNRIKQNLSSAEIELVEDELRVM